MLRLELFPSIIKRITNPESTAVQIEAYTNVLSGINIDSKGDIIDLSIWLDIIKDIDKDTSIYVPANEGDFECRMTPATRLEYIQSI